MHYNPILAFLNNKQKLSGEEEQNIRKYFRFAKAQRKEKIVTSNSRCDKIVFVNKGIIRAYCNKEKEVTRMIVSENQFLTNMNSFHLGKENTETFECLEDTEYLYITKPDMNKLLESSPIFKVMCYDILAMYNAVLVTHIHFITNSEVCTKIQYFKTNFPNLIGRISDQILASFIGVSRETIGRNKDQLH